MSGFIVIIASCNDDDTSDVKASVISIDNDNDTTAKIFPTMVHAINAMVSECEEIVQSYIDEAIEDYNADEMPELDSIACWGFCKDEYSKADNKQKAWISVSDGFTFFSLEIIRLG